jgi:hypothetical protein
MRSPGMLNFLQNYLKLLLKQCSTGIIQAPVIPESIKTGQRLPAVTPNKTFATLLKRTISCASLKSLSGIV